MAGGADLRTRSRTMNRASSRDLAQPMHSCYTWGDDHSSRGDGDLGLQGPRRPRDGWMDGQTGLSSLHGTHSLFLSS